MDVLFLGTGTGVPSAWRGSPGLVHFNPECDGRDLLGPIAAEYRGPVTLAEDLDRITL